METGDGTSTCLAACDGDGETRRWEGKAGAEELGVSATVLWVRATVLWEAACLSVAMKPVRLTLGLRWGPALGMGGT